MKYWFEEKVDQPEHRQNRLKRIAHESHEQEESQIEGWVDLGKKMLDGDDDDPTSSKA
jgi:hypothetical protein